MAMNRRAVFLMVAAVILIFLFMYPRGRQGASYFEPMGMSLAEGNSQGSESSSLRVGESAPVNFKGPTFDVSGAGLIPREVTATEDFGQFSPANILSGQNYLDPRSQIGFPETVGGVLRNANRQERSEPINPRDPVSIWNLSTIPPDTMRPRFEITPEWQ